MSIKFLQANAPEKPTAPPPFTLSPIQRTHAWWLYIWPFQSRRMLLITAVLLSAGSLLMTTILLWLDPGPLPYALAGCIIGGVYFGPYRALPAQMTITTRSDARHFVQDVKELVLSAGYIISDRATEAGRTHYCNKLRDKLGGWLSWDESDIDLWLGPNEIELRGPIAAMEWLQARLIKRLAA